MSLEFLIKVVLIRNFTLLLKTLGKECPPMFPKWGPYGNRHPFPEMFHFWSPPSTISQNSQ
jgi:hypothetical protein